MKLILKTTIFCLLILSIVADVVSSPASALADDGHVSRSKKTFRPTAEALTEQAFIDFIPMYYKNALFTSGIQITNVESTEAVITVAGYAEDGNISFIFVDSIEANGTVSYLDRPEIPNGFAGALVVSSDKQVKAVVTISGSDSTTNAAYLGSSAGSASVYLPLLTNNADDLTTWYSLQNAGSGPANVTIEYSDGTNATATIPIGAPKIFYQDLEQHADGAVFAGVITSDQPIVAAVVQQGPEMLLAYNGQTNGVTNPIFASIYEHNGGYVAGIQLQNIGNQSSEITLEYIPIELFGNTLGVPCEETIVIEPGATELLAYGAFVDPALSIGVDNCVVGEQFIGSAQVVKNSTNQPLVGVVYQQNPDTAGEIHGFFNPEDATDTVVFPAIMDRYNEYFTIFQIDHVGGPASHMKCTSNNPSWYSTVDWLEVGASLINMQLNNIRDGYVGSVVCKATDSNTKIIGVINRMKSDSPDDTFLTYEGINIGDTSAPPPPPNGYDCSAVSQIPQSECEALVAIYNNTGGPSWVNNRRWLETVNPCRWFGVRCAGGHVTELNLGRNGQGNGLVGDLPPEIGDLPYLEWLDLWANQLDSIPDEIGALSSLITLDLDENNLTSLPDSIGDLTSLLSLYLSMNQLSSLPDSIENLVNLVDLWLLDNQLTALPNSFFNLSGLDTLYLNNNHLSCISDEIGNLYNLTYLDINHNHITSANPDLLNVLAEMASGWAATQTAAPTWLGIDGIPLYLSASEGGRVDGVSYSDEDILVFDQCTSTWSLYFDGSDVGLRNKDINAFHVLDNGQILMSLAETKKINGVKYDDSDIIRFKPTSLGHRTRGSFSIYFDGSDVQLTKNGEDIDAIARLSNGDLVISTLGTAKVSGATARDEDMLRFHKETLGQNTKGTWSLYLDGSDIKLSDSSEDIWAAWVNGDTDDIHLSTFRDYSAGSSGTSQNGDSDDIFVCTPDALGSNTLCQLSLYWNGDQHNFGNAQIDGYSVGPMPPDAFINSVTGAAVEDVDEEAEDLTERQNDDVLDDDEYTEHIYLPLIAQ